MPIDDKDATDLSDVRTDAGSNPDQSDLSPMVLPIRGEKRIIPAPVSPGDMSTTFADQYTKSGKQPPSQHGPTGRTSLIDQSDFFLKAAMGPYIDYVYIRLPHRGIGTDKKADTTKYGVYRFLINPSQVAVARTTIDAQAMTRAGWQIGVWGEDSLHITLNGKTAGQYWSFGITDRYQEFTESYRNLAMLQMVFENNGYWFEGEDAGEGPLAADFTRRRIKMHSDVELIVGNFMWYGMFESLTVSQNAEEPWLSTFSLSFIAWRERFRAGSPYHNQIANNIQRGHSYESWVSAAPDVLNGMPSNTSGLSSLLPPVEALPPSQPPPPVVQPAALVSQAQEISRAFATDPSAVDQTPPPTRSYFRNTPGMTDNG